MQFTLQLTSNYEVGTMYHHNLVNVMQQNKNQGMMQSTAPIQPNHFQIEPNLPGNTQLASVILDSSSAIKLTMGTAMYHERSLMARNDIWHRVLVMRGGTHPKEVVLKSILKAVQPADLIPVKYQVIGEDSCFIIRNCDKALDQLCKTSLIVRCLDGSPLVLSITLGFASIHDLKINIQPLLLTVLKKRLNAERKTLNLDDFHKDPDIYDIVYCPLSQCRTMTHVLKLAKNALGYFDHLSLQHNELTTLATLDSASLKTVKYLDLRHNELLRAEELEPLKALTISELWLDGNPLCENYSAPVQYVEAVREYSPKLSKLDGVQLNAPGLPLIFKSYVKNWKRRKLVEQFVQHFFTAYDFRDRNVLRGLYCDDAWYSITVGTPTSPMSKKFLEPFGSGNRNLLIFGKNSQQLLHHGQDEILKVLKKLPASQHIYKSFCCDLIYDTPEAVSISVEGLFKLNNVASQIFSFNRTFILCAEQEDEFKIMNDQYHVYLPVTGINIITYNIENDESPPKFVPNFYSHSEKETLLLDFQESTTMTLEQCEKYLKAVNWDMKKALSNFIYEYKKGTLPKDAF